jgi:hypothetical protein
MLISLPMVSVATYIVATYIMQLSVLDPVLKRGYLDAAWDDEYIKLGMESLKARVCTLP